MTIVPAPNEKNWPINIPQDKAEQATTLFRNRFPECKQDVAVIRGGTAPMFDDVKLIFTCSDIPAPNEITAFIAEVETTLNG